MERDLEVITIGETMGLLHSLHPGRLDLAHAVGVSIGGAESNTAIGLARLGVAAAWLGRVGADAFGERILRTLRAESVDVVEIIDAHAPTGLMVKERRSSTQTSVSYYRSGSAGSRLTPGDIPAGIIENARVLHVTGITPALSGDAKEAIFAAIRRARAAGVRVSFDVNHRSRLWDAGLARPVYRELIASSDIVFAGVEEAALVLDTSETSALLLAHGLAALGPSEVIIKRGAEGADAHIDGNAFHVDAVPVDVIDTVGAGDAFVAGYLAERVRAASPESCLRMGASAGACACTAAGDWESLPTREDVASLTRTDPVAR
ncbi:sugar kinase [Microbacterium sp. Be9]|uniref:sugar kinase n=1 Tax=Microbacterium sp. Be9 TaxID=2720211 RepID=UPI001423EF04|nr:sugar kinase [Microbacterium sp. Be9]NIG66805.1 sugar kinase [Microbacterium sp. Be9]